jgi:hypothetical protein
MRELVVHTFLTLDGVMQAPGAQGGSQRRLLAWRLVGMPQAGSPSSKDRESHVMSSAQATSSALHRRAIGAAEWR